jgi:hypothetical protein
MMIQMTMMIMNALSSTHDIAGSPILPCAVGAQGRLVSLGTVRPEPGFHNQRCVCVLCGGMAWLKLSLSSLFSIRSSRDFHSLMSHVRCIYLVYVRVCPRPLVSHARQVHLSRRILLHSHVQGSRPAVFINRAHRHIHHHHRPRRTRPRMRTTVKYTM